MSKQPMSKKETAALAQEAQQLLEQTEDSFLDSTPAIDLPAMLEMVRTAAVKNSEDPILWSDDIEEQSREAELESLMKRAKQAAEPSTSTASTNPATIKTDLAKQKDVWDSKRLPRKISNQEAKRERSMLTMKQKPEVFLEASTEYSGGDNAYQESTASVMDISEFRNDLDALNNKVDGMSEQLRLVLSEREILPDKLLRMRQDMNQQFTLMLDKLNVSLEHNVSSSAAVAASSDIAAIKLSTDENLASAASYLTVEPTVDSPLVSTKGKLTKGKKFKPLK